MPAAKSVISSLCGILTDIWRHAPHYLKTVRRTARHSVFILQSLDQLIDSGDFRYVSVDDFVHSINPAFLVAMPSRKAVSSIMRQLTSDETDVFIESAAECDVTASATFGKRQPHHISFTGPPDECVTLFATSDIQSHLVTGDSLCIPSLNINVFITLDSYARFVFTVDVLSAPAIIGSFLFVPFAILESECQYSVVGRRMYEQALNLLSVLVSSSIASKRSSQSLLWAFLHDFGHVRLSPNNTVYGHLCAFVSRSAVFNEAIRARAIINTVCCIASLYAVQFHLADSTKHRIKDKVHHRCAMKCFSQMVNLVTLVVLHNYEQALGPRTASQGIADPAAVLFPRHPSILAAIRMYRQIRQISDPGIIGGKGVLSGASVSTLPSVVRQNLCRNISLSSVYDYVVSVTTGRFGSTMGSFRHSAVYDSVRSIDLGSLGSSVQAGFLTRDSVLDGAATTVFSSGSVLQLPFDFSLQTLDLLPQEHILLLIIGNAVSVVRYVLWLRFSQSPIMLRRAFECIQDAILLKVISFVRLLSYKPEHIRCLVSELNRVLDETYAVYFATTKQYIDTRLGALILQLCNAVLAAALREQDIVLFRMALLMLRTVYRLCVGLSSLRRPLYQIILKYVLTTCREHTVPDFQIQCILFFDLLLGMDYRGCSYIFSHRSNTSRASLIEILQAVNAQGATKESSEKSEHGVLCGNSVPASVTRHDRPYELLPMQAHLHRRSSLRDSWDRSRFFTSTENRIIEMLQAFDFCTLDFGSAAADLYGEAYFPLFRDIMLALSTCITRYNEYTGENPSGVKVDIPLHVLIAAYTRTEHDYRILGKEPRRRTSVEFRTVADSAVFVITNILRGYMNLSFVSDPTRSPLQYFPYDFYKTMLQAYRFQLLVEKFSTATNHTLVIEEFIHYGYISLSSVEVSERARNAAVSRFLIRYNALLNKKGIGELIGGPSNILLLEEFCIEVFASIRSKLTSAVTNSFLYFLRMFLSFFRIPGEAQQIDRILQAFSRAFAHEYEQISSCAAGAEASGCKLTDASTIYLLAFAVLILNTDAHNVSVKNKMSEETFVTNTLAADKSGTLTAPFLSHVYFEIKAHPFTLEDISESKVLATEGPRGLYAMFEQSIKSAIHDVSSVLRRAEKSSVSESAGAGLTTALCLSAHEVKELSQSESPESSYQNSASHTHSPQLPHTDGSIFRGIASSDMLGCTSDSTLFTDLNFVASEKTVLLNFSVCLLLGRIKDSMSHYVDHTATQLSGSIMTREALFHVYRLLPVLLTLSDDLPGNTVSGPLNGISMEQTRSSLCANQSEVLEALLFSGLFRLRKHILRANIPLMAHYHIDDLLACRSPARHDSIAPSKSPRPQSTVGGKRDEAQSAYSYLDFHKVSQHSAHLERAATLAAKDLRMAICLFRFLSAHVSRRTYDIFFMAYSIMKTLLLISGHHSRTVMQDSVMFFSRTPVKTAVIESPTLYTLFPHAYYHSVVRPFATQFVRMRLSFKHLKIGGNPLSCDLFHAPDFCSDLFMHVIPNALGLSLCYEDVIIAVISKNVNISGSSLVCLPPCIALIIMIVMRFKERIRTYYKCCFAFDDETTNHTNLQLNGAEQLSVDQGTAGLQNIFSQFSQDPTDNSPKHDSLSIDAELPDATVAAVEATAPLSDKHDDNTQLLNVPSKDSINPIAKTSGSQENLLSAKLDSQTAKNTPNLLASSLLMAKESDLLDDNVTIGDTRMGSAAMQGSIFNDNDTVVAATTLPDAIYYEFLDEFSHTYNLLLTTALSTWAFSSNSVICSEIAAYICKVVYQHIKLAVLVFRANHVDPNTYYATILTPLCHATRRSVFAKPVCLLLDSVVQFALRDDDFTACPLIFNLLLTVTQRYGDSHSTIDPIKQYYLQLAERSNCSSAHPAFPEIPWNSCCIDMSIIERSAVYPLTHVDTPPTDSYTGCDSKGSRDNSTNVYPHELQFHPSRSFFWNILQVQKSMVGDFEWRAVSGSFVAAISALARKANYFSTDELHSLMGFIERIYNCGIKDLALENVKLLGDAYRASLSRQCPENVQEAFAIYGRIIPNVQLPLYNYCIHSLIEHLEGPCFFFKTTHRVSRSTARFWLRNGHIFQSIFTTTLVPLLMHEYTVRDSVVLGSGIITMVMSSIRSTTQTDAMICKTISHAPNSIFEVLIDTYMTLYGSKPPRTTPLILSLFSTLGKLYSGVPAYDLLQGTSNGSIYETFNSKFAVLVDAVINEIIFIPRTPVPEYTRCFKVLQTIFNIMRMGLTKPSTCEALQILLQTSVAKLLLHILTFVRSLEPSSITSRLPLDVSSFQVDDSMATSQDSSHFAQLSYPTILLSDKLPVSADGCNNMDTHTVLMAKSTRTTPVSTTTATGSLRGEPPTPGVPEGSRTHIRESAVDGPPSSDDTAVLNELKGAFHLVNLVLHLLEDFQRNFEAECVRSLFLSTAVGAIISAADICLMSLHIGSTVLQRQRTHTVIRLFDMAQTLVEFALTKSIAKAVFPSLCAFIKQEDCRIHERVYSYIIQYNESMCGVFYEMRQPSVCN